VWNATVLSLFPEMFPGTLDFSIAGKALRKNLWSLKTVNILVTILKVKRQNKKNN